MPLLACDALRLYVKKLSCRIPLPQPLCEAILAIKTTQKHFPAAKDIAIEGDILDHGYVVVAGMVSRDKELSDGSRQILGLHLPGDFVYMNFADLPLDHCVRAHAGACLLPVSRQTLADIVHDYPVFKAALILDLSVGIATMGQWMGNLGRRNVLQRTAHLLLELSARYEFCGLNVKDEFPMPLSQMELADALGTTLVHLNRTLQTLRRAGMVETRQRGRIRILDRAGMSNIGSFDPGYLRLQSRGASQVPASSEYMGSYRTSTRA